MKYVGYFVLVVMAWWLLLRVWEWTGPPCCRCGKHTRISYKKTPICEKHYDSFTTG